MSAAVEGVGVGLRRSLYEGLLATDRPVDWLEIVAESFVDAGGQRALMLARCAERWPIVAHGVTLSVGGPDPMDATLDALRPLLRALSPPFVTDHLCYASVGGHQTFDLLPLPFHPEAVTHVAARAREAQDRLETPLLLENITYYATMPGSVMSEPAFIRAVLDEADCGLLLDVNNLYLNAVNHGHDPFELLTQMPLERARQVHLAGFSRQDDVLLDTHSRPVAEPVWALYEQALMRTGPLPTLIEWDQDIPSIDAVLDQVERARHIQRVVAERGVRGAA
jgi:uncharacterized protein (UPF0276 family)